MQHRTYRTLFKFLFLAPCFAFTLLLSGCATTTQQTAQDPADPWEAVNRKTFKFNDALDKTVITPASNVYQTIIPQPIRRSVGNFLLNIKDAYSMVNHVLQARPKEASEDLMRVTINSVFGIFGLIDFATPAGLTRHDADLGQTLGVWGIPSGPYVVLPLFGPSTVRDTSSLVGAIYSNPITYAHYTPWWPDITFYGLSTLDQHVRLTDASELVDQAALDRYTFIKSAYLQRRQAMVHPIDDNDSLPEYDTDDDKLSGNK